MKSMLIEAFKSSVLSNLDKFARNAQKNFSTKQQSLFQILTKNRRYVGDVDWANLSDEDITKVKPGDARRKPYSDMLLFWVSLREKPNPYMEDFSSSAKTIPAGALLGVTIGKSFISTGGYKSSDTKTGLSDQYGFGLNNSLRLANLSDVVYAIDTSSVAGTADVRASRAASQRGAAMASTAKGKTWDNKFKIAKERAGVDLIRKNNIARYKKILADKFSDAGVSRVVQRALQTAHQKMSAQIDYAEAHQEFERTFDGWGNKLDQLQRAATEMLDNYDRIVSARKDLQQAIDRYKEMGRDFDPEDSYQMANITEATKRIRDAVRKIESL